MYFYAILLNIGTILCIFTQFCYVQHLDNFVYFYAILSTLEQFCVFLRIFVQHYENFVYSYAILSNVHVKLCIFA